MDKNIKIELSYDQFDQLMGDVSEAESQDIIPHEWELYGDDVLGVHVGGTFHKNPNISKETIKEIKHLNKLINGVNMQYTEEFSDLTPEVQGEIKKRISEYKAEDDDTWYSIGDDLDLNVWSNFMDGDLFIEAYLYPVIDGEIVMTHRDGEDAGTQILEGL